MSLTNEFQLCAVVLPLSIECLKYFADFRSHTLRFSRYTEPGA